MEGGGYLVDGRIAHKRHQNDESRKRGENMPRSRRVVVVVGVS